MKDKKTQELADLLHKTFCKYSHEDQCAYHFINSWDELNENCCAFLYRKPYYDKAEKIIKISNFKTAEEIIKLCRF